MVSLIVNIKKEAIKLYHDLLIILIMTCVMTSCSDEIVSNAKTTDFVPSVHDYQFFIEGEIEDKRLHYKQIDYEWTNVSNKYFIDEQETWLQAYTDSIDSEGSWRVRIHGLDIEALELPYTLLETEGSIRWYDSRVDLIIASTDFCQGIDNGCLFALSPQRGNIAITSVDNEIIQGCFEGTAIIVRTGFTPGEDQSLYHEIENGRFRIRYTKE